MEQRLIDARKRKGLQQNELADRIHVSPQAYSLYERGLRHPPWETLIKIVRELDVSADYLLGLTDDPRPSYPADSREREALKAYHQLDERGKNMIDVTLKEQIRYVTGPGDEEP